MAQADNCRGLQHCTMMHALCQANCEKPFLGDADAPEQRRLQLCLDNCQNYYNQCAQKEMAGCK